MRRQAEGKLQGPSSPDDRDTDSRSQASRLVVAVPAFNEAKTIEETIGGLRTIKPRLAELGVELSVYVIDDGSSDDTGVLANGAGADKVLQHRVNQGLGAAVRTGLRAAREEGFDLLVKFDADLQHRPEEIVDLVTPILEDRADIVYGNRMEGIQYRMPFLRRIGNLVFSRLMRSLTQWPLEDSQPGIFAVSQEYLRVFNIPGDYNYTQQVLLDAYHKHMRFEHVPVTFHERTSGRSFVSLKYPLKVLPQILLVIVSIKPLKIFVPIGLAFVLLGCGVFSVQLVWWWLGHTSRPVENVNLVLGSGLFGVQTVFFGILAELVVQARR